MLEDIGKEIKKVKECLKDAMFVNGYIYNFVGLVNLMRKFTNQRNLHRPAITRFATSFITLAQIHKQKLNLQKMVTSKEWHETKWAKESKGKEVTMILLKETFWRDIVYTLKVTGPLVSVLRLVDGERKPAMGYIYEAMDRAKDTIKKSFSYNEQHYKKVEEIIDRRWSCQLSRPLHYAGYVLNPSTFYKDPENIKQNEKIIEGLHACIERLSPDTDTEDEILKQLNKYYEATNLFGRSAAVRQRTILPPGNYIFFIIFFLICLLLYNHLTLYFFS